MDISIITSLYQAETFLPAYIDALARVAATVRAAGPRLELIVIANEPTPAEDRLLVELAARADAASVRVERVPRETLYASWNRGVRLAAGRVVGFWNVDDLRTADGLLEGLRRIDGGCDLVYFPWLLKTRWRWLGRFDVPHNVYQTALPYHPETFTAEMKAGPFFMFRREFYAINGPFDERFRVSGDFDWCVRAIEHTTPCPGTSLAGSFNLHAANLSAEGKNYAENNIVFVKAGRYDRLFPADPDTMRRLWSRWEDSLDLTPATAAALADQLWGDGAADRWAAWQAEREQAIRQRARSETLRLLPRLLIDYTGLRRVLYRLGVVRSAHPHSR